VTPEARDTVLDCLLIREEDLRERIAVWMRKGGKATRTSKDGLIADAQAEIARIAEARRQMIVENLEGTCTPTDTTAGSTS